MELARLLRGLYAITLYPSEKVIILNLNCIKKLAAKLITVIIRASVNLVLSEMGEIEKDYSDAQFHPIAF